MLHQLIRIALLAGGIIITNSPVIASKQSNSPNFLFIFVDDQAWSGTSVPMVKGNQLSRTPGYNMPNLEKMAANGMVFSQAYAGHPKCECSRASLLMGRSTTSLNAVDKNSRNWNAPNSASLPNTLKRANPTYRAAHFGKWQWQKSPESMGYDASDGITMNEDGDTSDPRDPKQTFGITQRATAYMQKQVNEGHPFYLQLSFYAVHAKPQALESTLKKYQNLNSNNAIMAAMTEDLDTCIGTLHKEVEKLGISQNTYIIYMADNGMRSQALKGGKALLDEGGIRVPLIISGPRVKPGTYSNAVMVGYDLLATVIDFVNPKTQLPQGTEGGSWKPVLMNAGAGTVKRPIERLVFHHDVEIEHPQTAMRKGDLKLLHYWDTKQNFLYDLSTDLREQNNLASAKPELTEELLSELKAHVKAGLGEQKFNQLESGQLPTSTKPNQRQGGKRGGGGKGNGAGNGGRNGGGNGNGSGSEIGRRLLGSMSQ